MDDHSLRRGLLAIVMTVLTSVAVMNALGWTVQAVAWGTVAFCVLGWGNIVFIKIKS